MFYPRLVSLRPQGVHARQIENVHDVSGNKTVKDTEDQRTRYQGAREVSELISKSVYFIHSFISLLLPASLGCFCVLSSETKAKENGAQLLK